MAKKPKIDPNNIREYLEYSWMGLGDISQYNTKGPLVPSLFKNGDDAIPTRLLDTMISPEYLSFTCQHFLGVELLPFQAAILYELWVRPFPMLIGTRGLGKTFLLSVYCVLRAFLCQNVKIVVVGAAFRQSKLIFEYIADIWKRAELLRNVCGTGKEQGPHIETDRCTMIIGSSKIVAIPLGDGQRIRGLRANYIIADEFASISRDIYENVIKGFAAVSSNPVENVKHNAMEEAKTRLGIDNVVDEDDRFKGNQCIISGTAYYAFNHFYEYFLKYRSIIQSKGNIDRLREIFNGEVPTEFNWKDFSVIRIPVDLLPKGFMDAKQVASSKASVHSGIYNMEYGAVFSKDSNGFYKMTMLQACVANHTNLDSLPTQDIFKAMTKGYAGRKYIYGIDPASERDNFSIVVLEVHPTHRRIVHVWTTTRKRFKEVLSKGLTEEKDFYKYCAKKIRSLMKIFPCLRIMMDSQGGGIGIEEALQDPSIDEAPVYRVIDKDDPRPSDHKHGEHLLEMVNFADAAWVRDANHGMRKDFEDKILLFPEFDPIVIGVAIEEDKLTNKIYDTLEDCYLEIEELKTELTSIIHTQTGIQGREKWDTPEEKLPGGRKGRQHKDRYSALLMANMGARLLAKVEPPVPYVPLGGWADSIGKAEGKMVIGPAWFTSGGYQGGEGV